MGSSGGEEELAENKYDGLSKKMAASYKSVAVGAMAAILAEAASEPTAEEGRKMEARSAARKKARAKKAPGVAQAKRSRGMFEIARSDDETDDSEEPMKKKTRKDESTPASSKKRKASEIAEDFPGKDRSTQLPSGDIEVDSAGGGGEQYRRYQDGAGGLLPVRGAPKKDPRTIAEGQWDEFCQAKAESTFFGERSLVQRRLVARWLGRVGTLMLNADASNKDTYELAKKRLQMIEHGIGMVRSWATRRDMAAGLAAFARDWDVLMTLSLSRPVVILACRHLWDLWFQVQTSRSLDDGVSIVAELRRSQLLQHFKGVDGDWVTRWQHKTVREWICNCTGLRHFVSIVDVCKHSYRCW